MEAFFLPTPEGARFCIYHAPVGPPRAGVVFVHAFAEEMNKSRHVVAQTARRLAALGMGVLAIDLKGCGDSTGAFGHASWDDWRGDLRLAASHMRQRGHGSLVLWGMRSGALLAAQCAAEMPEIIARCLLWQPVVHGETFLAQFLRLRVAGAMLSGAKEAETGKTLRARLAAGETLEIAGYDLSPSMAAALEQLELGSLRPPCPVDWLEVTADGQRPLPPAASRVKDDWRARGIPLTLTPVVAEAFWGATSAAELVQCPALVEATVSEAMSWR